jgi:biotin-dependent carboxylase-like uncharacterized protein
MSGLKVVKFYPGTTIQDQGRLGFQRFGVTAGGAIDRYALAQGQALLGNNADVAAVEFAGAGGVFQAVGDLWLATSGAEMPALVDDRPIAWRRSFYVRDGQRVELGAAKGGVYSYLHIAGGFQTEISLGSRSNFGRGGMAAQLETGLILGAAEGLTANQRTLPARSYFDRRNVYFVKGPQTDLFPQKILDRFQAEEFTVTASRDRMGMRLEPEGGLLTFAGGLSTLSEACVVGDIQLAGDGRPAILLADRQPTGGYPRIGTVISAHLAAVAQMPVGHKFGFEFVSQEKAVGELKKWRDEIAGLPGKVQNLVRDPAEIADLLAYSLVDGVIRGDEDENS